MIMNARTSASSTSVLLILLPMAILAVHLGDIELNNRETISSPDSTRLTSLIDKTHQIENSLAQYVTTRRSQEDHLTSSKVLEDQNAMTDSEIEYLEPKVANDDRKKQTNEPTNIKMYRQQKDIKVHKNIGLTNTDSSSGVGINDNRYEYLDSLPILSLTQKQSALFECEFDKTSETSPAQDEGNSVDEVSSSTKPNLGFQTVPLSLGNKMITKDKRFKVTRHSSTKWSLQIDDVNLSDDKAYYLCQIGLSTGKANVMGSFAGGALLNVRVPPKFIEENTTIGQVEVNEYEKLTIKCTVKSEPYSSIVWRREDLQGLDEIAQKFTIQSDPNSNLNKRGPKMTTVTSSLIFNSTLRQHAATYLCIAYNGIQSGVSQRITVKVINCRPFPNSNGPTESCDRVSSTESYSTQTIPTTTATQTRPTTTVRGGPWNKPTKSSAPGSDNRSRRVHSNASFHRHSSDKRRINASPTFRAEPERSGTSSKSSLMNPFEIRILSALICSSVIMYRFEFGLIM